jgi:L-rhamnose mutarotase
VKKFALTLDLKNDPALIAEYKRYHQPDVVWPEVINHIRVQGVFSQQIYLLGTRMFMILETSDEFSFSAKDKNDRASPVMQRWEDLMLEFQQILPLATAGEKWILMENIFDMPPL